MLCNRCLRFPKSLFELESIALFEEKRLLAVADFTCPFVSFYRPYKSLSPAVKPYVDVAVGSTCQYGTPLPLSSYFRIARIRTVFLLRHSAILGVLRYSAIAPIVSPLRFLPISAKKARNNPSLFSRDNARLSSKLSCHFHLS